MHSPKVSAVATGDGASDSGALDMTEKSCTDHVYPSASGTCTSTAELKKEHAPSPGTPSSYSMPNPQPKGRGGRGKRVSALINRGVQWETWLVGLQHRLLLGINTSPNDGVALSNAKEGGGSDGGGGACACPKTNTFPARTATSGRGDSAAAAAASAGCAFCPPRRRYLYRLVAGAADFSERASFHSGFLSWTYASRLLAVGAYFFMAVYVNALATMISTHRNPYAMMLDRSGEPLTTHTLPDLGHDLWAFCLTGLGYHTDYIDEHALPDRIVKFASNVVFPFILCHPQRLMILRRVFTVFGTVLLLRAVSVSVTVLPDASPVCRARLEEGTVIADLFPRAFLEAVQFSWSPTRFVTCGDMVFSGHTTCLVMVAMTFRKYCRAENLQTKVIFRGFHLPERLLSVVRRGVYAYVVMGCLVIIGSKLHYTLDVLLAVLICTCAFSWYHDWARYEPLRKRFRLVEWLESEDVQEQDDLAYTLAIRP